MRRAGCSGCGSREHNLTGCDDEEGARHLDARGRHDQAAKVRRRVALLAPIKAARLALPPSR